MDGLVDRVVNGRIFKNFASFVRGESQTSKDMLDRPWTADCERSLDLRSFRTACMSSTSEGLQDTRKRRALGASASDTPSIMDIDDSQGHLSELDGSYYLHDDIHESRSSLADICLSRTSVVNHPPLTSRHLKIFTFQGGHGNVETGLSLTKTIVWQLNAIFQAENEIEAYTEAIIKVNEKLAEWGSLASELPYLIEDATNDLDRTALLESLQEAEEMVVSNERKRLQLVERFQYWKSEKELPLRQMLENFHVVLESNNLLEVNENELRLQDPEDDRSEEPISARSPSPSPSELAVLEKETEKQKAWDNLHDKRLRLQAAEATLEDFNIYCETKYIHYLQLHSEGVISASKTEFDLDMIQQRQKATRAYIKAEEDLNEALEYIRTTRLDFEQSDQESGFVSHDEDGHIDSMDPANVQFVDRERIERWLAGDSEAEGSSRDTDEWDCKSIGLYDSASIVADHVATGKRRKRIDEWRSMCELQNGDGGGKGHESAHPQRA